MNEAFMRERPVLPLIVTMSLPMVLSMLVNSLYNIVDSFFVAQISEASMTALSLVFPIQNLINALAIGFGVGLNAAISFYLGAERRDRASAAAVHGLALSAVHGVVLTGLTIALLPSFLEMFTQDPEVLALGVRYGRTVFCFSLLLSLGLAYEKIFQAVGRMKIPMAALLTGCLTNIVLDPLLIFGPGPFPRLGIEGAALATGIGQTLTLLVYLAAWRSCALPITLNRRELAWDWRLDLRLYSVGIPATLSLALPSLLISALNSILSAFSPIYVVILGIYYKLQTFLYLPASGIVQGMRPVIGYNYGAGEQGRVREIYRVTLGLCAAIMAAGTVLCLAIPAQLMGLFTQNPESIRAGAEALRIISAGFLVSSVSVAAGGALEGLGKGGPSLVISLLRYTLVMIPAAWLLSRLIGPAGVWHAFWLSEAVTALLSILIYRRSVR